MRWLELSVEADVEAVEAISEILGRVAAGTSVHPRALLGDPHDELAARPDPDAGYVVTAHVADDDGAAASVDATERALWHLRAFGLRPMSELRIRPVDDADWTEAWRTHYVPQRVGRILIVPSWMDREPAPPDGVTVTLDPGMAFGTGLHPTTRGCLALLSEMRPVPATVLDVGSGSGILAIAALRLGADRAVAVDTDPLAVETTRANAERNGVGEALVPRRGTLAAAGDERFDLVLANLVAAIHVELAERYGDRLAPGGQLVASGIIESRAIEVMEAFSGAGLSVAERRDDGEWTSLRVVRGAGSRR
jgi:ribosomal protein L11 methyltransferase